ncbi:MAG: DUF445 domain-containing protein [Prochlorotrichaceae cyanobacterium]|jgi:uncharacterized membrane protein YheB (UPF0754 family)
MLGQIFNPDFIQALQVNLSQFLAIAYYFIPPIAGGIIGYFTNDLAIQMLFRPYRARYLFGRKIPFTPGLIPSNQDRLARRISDAIMGSLLTPDELNKLTRKLLETERTQSAILWLLKLALNQLREGNDQKTSSILSNILQDLFGESLPRLIQVLAKQNNFLEAQLNQIFDRILIDFRLNDVQASQAVTWLLKVILPPNTLRQALVDFLTDRNIQIIDERLRQQTSGTYWFLANVFGTRMALTRLRSYCLDEKEESNRLIAELIESLGVRFWLKEGLQNFSLQNLPVSTVRQLRVTFGNSVREYLVGRGEQVLSELSRSIEWDNLANIIINRLQHSSIMDSSLEVVSQELALILDRYLEKDLEAIVGQIISILNLEQVIIRRVEATPPENLEQAIQGIVKSELQAIVNLGGILGFLIGSLQSLLLLFR